jgi:ATP-dependent helicase IRC3
VHPESLSRIGVLSGTNSLQVPQRTIDIPAWKCCCPRWTSLPERLGWLRLQGLAMTSTNATEAKTYCEYQLLAVRKQPIRQEPASHQKQAIEALWNWYQASGSAKAGGILVLPTGGGKTFTALRFTARAPLSDGYKVLWLAHTHHLLDQAFHGLERHVSHIAEPKESLAVRIVSGAPGHFRVADIKPSDDVVIGTVQSIGSADQEGHPQWKRFLDSCAGKLFVVFDEAHHVPAPSYRRLLVSLREECGEARLLGLTATPYYADENKAGWLRELFPQGILYQVTPAKLIASNVLSRPIMEEPHTKVAPDFDEREYEKWVGTNRDLPESLISNLAKNRTRNEFIAHTYVANREKYGKTIIFADRWFQCDYLREALCKRGVRADVVYSHVDSAPETVEERNRRDKDENGRVLEAFRKGGLDVLVNVKMLTEGTDIPDAQSVFITRQTTSKILMTQMVGRALRGPEFGGTKDAYIVCFTDDWRQLISWASYDELDEGGCDEAAAHAPKRPPLQLISIELVRHLARMMDSGNAIEPVPFLRHLPVGWYQISFLTRAKGSDDMTEVSRLVMVFEDEVARYCDFIASLLSTDVTNFAAEDLTLSDASANIQNLKSRWLDEGETRPTSCSDEDLFGILRHVAQNSAAPRYFAFEERERHDLDKVATEVSVQDLGPRQTDELLRREYDRRDRFWATLYGDYRLFKSQFDACMNRRLEAEHNGQSVDTYAPSIRTTPERLPEREPSEDVKRQVKQRDGNKCLCCHSEKGRDLTVDHVHSWHFGGGNVLDNLQTLCRLCNTLKGKANVSFRDPQTNLQSGPLEFRELSVPNAEELSDGAQLEMFLRRSINFFYQCGAVHEVRVASRGPSARHMTVELGVDNPVAWLEPFLPGLLERIRAAKLEGGLVAPDSISVSAPDQSSVSAGSPRQAATDDNAKASSPKNSLTKRALLPQLDVAALRDLMEFFEVEFAGARRKDELVDTLVRARRVSLEDILQRVNVEVLRNICRDEGCERPGRSRDEVLENLRAVYRN